MSTWTLSVLLVTSSAAGFTGQNPVVTTNLGPVMGAVEASDDGTSVAVFRGVPFAATTGGHNRFKPPQEREASDTAQCSPPVVGTPEGHLLDLLSPSTHCWCC
jgi:hypothetical protein